MYGYELWLKIKDKERWSSLDKQEHVSYIL